MKNKKKKEEREEKRKKWKNKKIKKKGSNETKWGFKRSYRNNNIGVNVWLFYHHDDILVHGF